MLSTPLEPSTGPVRFLAMALCAFLTGAIPGPVTTLAEELEDTGRAWSKCDDDADGKDGACGHAVAARGYAELHGSLPPLNTESIAAASDTDVTHCFLDIEVLTGTNPKSIAGSNTLNVTSLINGLTQFTLDLRSNMVVDAVTVNGASATYNRTGNQIVITLGATYNAGQSFQVKVTYHGSPSSRTFFSSFSFFNTHNGNTVASTLSQPYQANYWWPCKDNFVNTDDKFTMDMWVTVPDSMVVASNGLLQGTDTLSGSRLRYRWQESYPIATYLVSFAATNYTKQTYYHNHPGGSMPIEFYIYPESVSASEPYLADIVQAVATYSDVYGQYPFINEKYGIAQFAWCCGMEHQTMTSQGAYTSERRNVHELSHSWWGDFVTCKTWHDVWLNEGFATFSEAVWYENQPGGSYQAYLDQMLSRKPSLFADTVYCYDISDIDRIFSTNYTYNKGGWVVHMLRFVLGDAVFYAGLQDYRDAYAAGAADTTEFQAIMEAASGQDLDWFFNQWVFGGGGPYYKRGWQNTTIAGQPYVRYYINQYQRETLPAYPYFKMPVELAITTGGGTTTQTVWNDAEKQWYLLPVGAAATDVAFDEDIHILRANDQNVSYVNGPPKLMQAVPAPNSLITPPPPVNSIELYFSEAITYSASDFSVTGNVSGSQSFTVGYDAGSYKITLSFAQPLADNQVWTVQVSDTMKSQAGNLALDGEMEPAFPSGNGVPGGAAMFSFTLGEAPPPCPATFGDTDDDDDVDLDDFGAFQLCLTGAGDPGGAFDVPNCGCFDRDGDSDIDEADVTIFTNCLSGAGIPANPTCDDSWTSLSENFDAGDAAGRWTVFGSSADYTAEFAFDYSSVGIAPAPNSAGTTTGLKFTVNNNDAVAAAAAVSAFPTGRNFSGNFTLTFDMWMNYPGSGSASGTTEMMNVGINTTGSQVIWPSNPGNGIVVAVTGEGDGAPGTSADYHYYRGATLLGASSGVYAAGTGSTAQDHANAWYQTVFPSPPFPVAGAPGKQWVQVELSQTNGTVAWKMNGSTIASSAETTYTSGNIMLGYMDLWSSIANPAAEAFILYDNVKVVTSAP